MLAVAGGAAGAVLVYRARELTLIRSLPLPGVVSAAAFAGAELLALCAVDEGRLQSRLFRISIHGVVSALGCWEGLPGALLIHPDGMIVCGVLGKLLLLRPDGRFGPMTREAVITFQSTHHLHPTGEVNTAVWDALEGAHPPFPCQAAR